MDKGEAMILVVDDEEAIREVLCRKLRSRGYACEAAADGEQALWKAFMCDYALVLMDVRMPKLSGMDVLPRMVVDHPDTSVVMLTAIADTQTAVEAMKLGAYDYVTKPFNMDDVLLRVEKALERRRLLLENREYQRRLEQRVQRQAGEIRKSNHEAEAALSREQAALAELEALRQSRSGFAQKVAGIAGGSSDDSSDEAAGSSPTTA